MKITLKIMFLSQSRNFKRRESVKKCPMQGTEVESFFQVPLGVPHRAKSWTRWSSWLPSNWEDSRIPRKGRGVLLSLQVWLNEKELILKKSHEQDESLWVKIKDRSSKGHLMFGVSHSLPEQRQSVDKASLFSYRNHSAHRFSSQWGIATTWVAAGKTIQQAVSNSWDSQSASELLVQVLEKLSQRRRVTGPVNELIRKIRDSLGCLNHIIAESSIWKNLGWTRNRVRTLKFGRANPSCWRRWWMKSPVKLSLETRGGSS